MTALHTTFARPLSITSIPDAFVQVPCGQCGTMLRIPASHSRDCQTCLTCERGEATRAVVEARAVIRDLIAGTGLFACLSREERQEQLDGFGLGARHTPRAMPNAERTVFVADEPIYTWDGDSPDAATRDEMEGRIELYDSDFGA